MPSTARDADRVGAMYVASRTQIIVTLLEGRSHVARRRGV